MDKVLAHTLLDVRGCLAAHGYDGGGLGACWSEDEYGDRMPLVSGQVYGTATDDLLTSLRAVSLRRFAMLRVEFFEGPKLAWDRKEHENGTA